MNDATTRPDSGAEEAPSYGRGPRHAVISGAGGGLGSVLAATFEARGCRLVLPARSGVDALREAHPGARVVEADLTDPNDCRRVADAAIEAFGGVDAVLNVAGGFATRSALELTVRDLEAQLDVNLRTAVGLPARSFRSWWNGAPGACWPSRPAQRAAGGTWARTPPRKRRSRGTSARCAP